MKQDKLTTLYYRGSLRSCNYACSYCPFHKSCRQQRGASRTLAETLAHDREALEKFCRRVPQLGQDLSVMLIPYGEALLYPYYHKALARLCQTETVTQAGCQTNLSFSIRDFCSWDYGGKLRLWCTFHPSQTRLDVFLEQCQSLYRRNISFSVGAVGIPENSETLADLRQRLPADVYLWINAQEGRRKPYTDSETDAFLAIDPLFQFEMDTHPACLEHCRGGQGTLFVDASGNAFACPISGRKMGNIYTGMSLRERLKETLCRMPACHCYLAYSNRKDIFEVAGMDAGRPFRIPNRQRAFFFDVDGTLTDESGRIPQEHIQTVARLAQSSLIFLATSLPYPHARRTCRDIWPYLAGGVFAEGSDRRIFAENYKKIIPLDEGLLEIMTQEGMPAFHTCTTDGVLHKMTVFNPGIHPEGLSGEETQPSGDAAGLPYNLSNLLASFSERASVRYVCEGKRLGIVAEEASKVEGILDICKRQRLFMPFVTVVGNSPNDIPMLRYFQRSVAVPAADEKTRAAAKTVCTLSLLV